MNNSSSFLHVICDYGLGDGAFGEVLQRLHAGTADLPLHLYPTSVDFSDTIAGGFWLYQYLTGKQGEQKLFAFSNIAPRKEQTAAMKNNSGEGLKYVKLTNGAEIVAVNANHIFSLVKPHIAEFKDINVSNSGTQFRSRDNYPQIMIELLHQDYHNLGTDLDLNTIPNLPENCLLWTDGYGNLKTSIRFSQVKKLNLSSGQKVRIEINNLVWEAIYADGSFSVAQGEIAFAPGSSGYDDPFMEIFLRRHNQLSPGAAEVFRFPHNGSIINFLPITK